MNTMFKKFNIENINVAEIDTDSFRESLLVTTAKTKANIKLVDEKINNLAITPVITGVSTMEQFDNVFDLMIIKNRLAVLYDLFLCWYEELPLKEKELYVTYFIKKDVNLCRKIGTGTYRKRYIKPMANGFYYYVKNNSKLDEEELIKNPFVYKAYTTVMTQREKPWIERIIGGKRRDNPGDEKLYC